MVTLCNCTQFTSGNQKILVTLTSLTQDLHSHNLLTGLGAPLTLRNGFQFFTIILGIFPLLVASPVLSPAVMDLGCSCSFVSWPDFWVDPRPDLLPCFVQGWLAVSRTHHCHQPPHIQVLYPGWWGHCLLTCFHYLWLLISLPSWSSPTLVAPWPFLCGLLIVHRTKSMSHRPNPSHDPGHRP